MSVRNAPVTVIAGEGGTVPQLADFRVCPLGIQFYSAKRIPEFRQVSLTISIPAKKSGAKERINCRGVVVYCMKAPKTKTTLYRTWVTFVDLPESKRKHIKCVAETSGLICPHCLNFG